MASKHDEELFIQLCEQTPATIPWHVLCFGSKCDAGQFSKVVTALIAKWKEKGIFVGRATVLGAYLHLYGTPTPSKSDLSSFVDALSAPGSSEEAFELRKAIDSDPIGGFLLRWHEGLDLWNRTSGGGLNDLQRALDNGLRKIGINGTGAGGPAEVLVQFLRARQEQLQTTVKRLKAAVRTRNSRKMRDRAREAKGILDQVVHFCNGYAGAVGKTEVSLLKESAGRLGENIRKQLKMGKAPSDEKDAKDAEVKSEGQRIVDGKLSMLGWLLLLGLVAVVVWYWLFWTNAEFDESVVVVRAGPQQGTGFLIDAETALFVTNRHVVEDGKGRKQACTIRLRNGPTLNAQVVGVSEEFDLALLRAEFAPGEAELPATLKLGATDSLKLSQKVTIIGHPAGKEFSRFSGEVVHIDREASFLTIDAQLDAGCSGAPVLVSGRVIGVVDALIGVHTRRPRVICIEKLKELVRKSGLD